MNYLNRILGIIGLTALLACGGHDEKKEKDNDDIQLGNYESSSAPKEEKSAPATAQVDMSDKGIGPVENVELSDEIDMDLAKKGETIYSNNCTACHKPTKKFIGPAPVGILDRRSPEWVMNMILNPTEMLQKDPIAKQLLVEYNGSPMADQNLTEDEARAVLEYFRTLK
ncbi:cytochrome C [Christiangramia fulva]|uniref:Cytochrome C n=1 Tax=Christiangramia fulva TaxID=2126553 RepID=A0A2R3ZAM7_9FLAO|nr:cytochrome c [Christiangramia fulva]AVR47311.1 cytochrome C [Christiangramia fulva]